MKKWKLYYSNDELLGFDVDTWSKAPPRGVLALVVESEEVGREIDWGNDYYIWWPGAEHPWSVDRAGLWDFLYEVGSSLAGRRIENENFDELIELGVKFGRSTSTRMFRRRLERISVDPEFPPKSGNTPREQLTQ